MTPSDIQAISSVVFGSSDQGSHRKALMDIWTRETEPIIREGGGVPLMALKTFGPVVSSLCHLADALARAEARIAELEKRGSQ